MLCGKEPEDVPPELWRVKHNLSKLITADKVPPASHELTRRYLAFINFDCIRDKKELKEVARR